MSYNGDMTEYFKPITFRPTSEALEAVEKIRRNMLTGDRWPSLTDIIIRALVEYAKTLSDSSAEKAGERAA